MVNVELDLNTNRSGAVVRACAFVCVCVCACVCVCLKTLEKSSHHYFKDDVASLYWTLYISPFLILAACLEVHADVMHFTVWPFAHSQSKPSLS